MSAAAADPGKSISNWDLADAPLERRTSQASPEHARFRELIQSPESESFWDRGQRWSDISKQTKAPGPVRRPEGKVSVPSDFILVDCIPLSDLSFALAPLLLAGGLLRLK